MANDWKDIEIGSPIDVQKIMEQIRPENRSKTPGGDLY